MPAVVMVVSWLVLWVLLGVWCAAASWWVLPRGGVTAGAGVSFSGSDLR